MLPWLSPSSYGAPDQAARSPSPEQSMNMHPRTARRPDFVSTMTASIALSDDFTAATARA
jgi:hypothetical protein